jgi:hypothetical protein
MFFETEIHRKNVSNDPKRFSPPEQRKLDGHEPALATVNIFRAIAAQENAIAKGKA